jgi:hypothetical protein
LEGELGLDTLELPISSVCRTRAFGAFVLAILNQLPRFQACYNESLLEYRLAHGIRSSAHPVPALVETDGWLESPLWIYGDADGRRRAAWVRTTGNRLEISDRAGRILTIDRPESDGSVDQMIDAQGINFKLRPRALMTTMFARLVLSDLFLHGIGGAKYDQLGDLIIERFFGIRAPEYCVTSATVLLPGWRQAVDAIQQKPSVKDIHQKLRDTKFSPESFAEQTELPSNLLTKKAELLASIPARGQKATWHKEISEVNRQLSQQLKNVETSLKEQHKHAVLLERELQIWLSREHAFPIFPLDYLLKSLGLDSV